ncbi:MAG TPA: hypothetical protein VE714_06310 [Gemmatimonadales bacterium]|nr:hypothetical protein [Gemmatimonadales bacterium]
MSPMHLALLVVLAQTQLVDIHDLAIREHRMSAFVLPVAQDVQITAIGAEPWPDRLRSREDERWQDDEQTTWPAAAWILDAKTRVVAWDLRAADTRRESDGLRHFSGTVRLPAGTYEAHYASYAAPSISFPGFHGDISSNLEDILRLGRRAKYGGHYAESGLYKQFGLAISGNGRAATPDDIAAARALYMASAIVSLAPDHKGTIRKGFEITRPTKVEVYSIGELTPDQAADYGWIMDAATRKPIWSMSYASTDPAGGAAKNRVAHETIWFKAGHYVAYFTCDDSHGPDGWNNMPATDPEFWGMTLRVADPTTRASVRPFDYEPVPPGQTIVSMTQVHDDEMRSSGFSLRRPMDLRIYALGEGFPDHMADYGWIVDGEQHKSVWAMNYNNTEHAGGAAKNRLFDGVIRLKPGNYLVYYRSDGSHSYSDWNGAPPAEDRYWGISVFPASGRLNPADIGPFMKMHTADFTVAELTHMGNDEDASRSFRLSESTRVRVVAIGEGRDGEMFDYGWIEDRDGRTVWKMNYDATVAAGGSDKNRAFDGIITLPAGSYVLRFRSDGSHSYDDWNDNPPDDPESWGIAVFRMARP